MLSVLDGDRTVFRSNVPISMGSMPREQSVSQVVAAMGRSGVLVVEDATARAPFNTHPMVTGPDGIRFYAGAAITTADGRAVGAFSVLDVKPRPRPGDQMLDALKLMAGMAGDILDQTAATRRIDEQLGVLRMAEQMSGVGHWRLELATNKVAWSHPWGQSGDVRPQLRRRGRLLSSGRSGRGADLHPADHRNGRAL
jgi:hypothetical protein